MRGIVGGALHRDAQQRLPRDAPRRRPHRQVMESLVATRRAALRHRPPRDGAADGLHVARDVHARRAAAAPRPRWSPCAGTSSATAADEIVVANTKGFTGHPMGVGVEDVIAVKILEHGIVPPVPNLQGGRPRPRRPEPEPRRPLPGLLRHPPGGRLRLADRDDADAPHPRRRSTASTTRPRYRRWLADVDRRRRGRDGGRQADAARRVERASPRARRAASPGPGAPHRRAAPRRSGTARPARLPAPAVRAEPVLEPPPVRVTAAAARVAASRVRPAPCSAPVADARAVLRSPPRRRRPAPDDTVTAEGDGHRRREDRLPARHARSRARPRGRPRRGHREAGRDLRRRARGVRPSRARRPEAARLPDAAPRREVRARPSARPAPPRAATMPVGGSSRGAGDRRRSAPTPHPPSRKVLRPRRSCARRRWCRR